VVLREAPSISRSIAKAASILLADVDAQTCHAEAAKPGSSPAESMDYSVWGLSSPKEQWPDLVAGS
jgi:hypothetical protein